MHAGQWFRCGSGLFGRSGAYPPGTAEPIRVSGTVMAGPSGRGYGVAEGTRVDRPVVGRVRSAGSGPALQG